MVLAQTRGSPALVLCAEDGSRVTNSPQLTLSTENTKMQTVFITSDRLIYFLLFIRWHKVRSFLPETKVTGDCGTEELFPLKNTPIFWSSIRTLWHITAKYKLWCHFPILQVGSFKSPVFLSQWWRYVQTFRKGYGNCFPAEQHLHCMFSVDSPGLFWHFFLTRGSSGSGITIWKCPI